MGENLTYFLKGDGYLTLFAKLLENNYFCRWYYFSSIMVLANQKKGNMKEKNNGHKGLRQLYNNVICAINEGRDEWQLICNEPCTFDNTYRNMELNGPFRRKQTCVIDRRRFLCNAYISFFDSKFLPFVHGRERVELITKAINIHFVDFVDP